MPYLCFIGMPWHPDEMDDEVAEATPNCPECLHRLEPDGRVWRCPSCGLVRL